MIRGVPSFKRRSAGLSRSRHCVTLVSGYTYLYLIADWLGVLTAKVWVCFVRFKVVIIEVYLLIFQVVTAFFQAQTVCFGTWYVRSWFNPWGVHSVLGFIGTCF